MVMVVTPSESWGRRRWIASHDFHVVTGQLPGLDTEKFRGNLPAVQTADEYIAKAKAQLKGSGLPSLTPGREGGAANDPFQYYKLAGHLARVENAPAEIQRELFGQAAAALEELRKSGPKLSW